MVQVFYSVKNITPYLSAGPAFNYVLKQNTESSLKLPLKKTDLLGEIGFGADIGFVKSKFKLSPELKFSKGFINMNDDINNFYTHAIDNLKRQVFTFSIYLRGM